MKTRSIIEGIYKDGLCLGCGLCESICGKDSVKMKLQENGFFRPVVKNVDTEKEKVVSKVCPGINVVNDLKFDDGQRTWGKIEELYSGYSNDQQIRKTGSSGGIISAIAVYMLENSLVDAVLQVGGDSTDYERNTLKISKTKEDVIECASSRYAPALIFDKIIEILDGNDNKYCFIGKPCDISGLKNLLEVYPQYKGRIKLTVSIMCAGMPSFKGTESIIDDFNASKPVKNLMYRGNGWPGFFSFNDSAGKQHQLTYNESWGKTLNKYLNFRCKICPDGIGLQADIAVGDAWETTDGYPDFSEKDGHSLIIVRTKIGSNLLEDAHKNSEITLDTLEIDKVALMQPYQFARRKRVAARLLAYSLGKRRWINYSNLKVFRNAFDEKPQSLIKEFIGTFRRTIKHKE